MVSTFERGAGRSPVFWVRIVPKIPQSTLRIVRMCYHDFLPPSFLGGSLTVNFGEPRVRHGDNYRSLVVLTSYR